MLYQTIFCLGKYWNSLDSVNWDEEQCKVLPRVKPTSIDLNAVKIACLTIPSCNLVKYTNSSYEFLSCPQPLTLRTAQKLPEATGAFEYAGDSSMCENSKR